MAAGVAAIHVCAAASQAASQAVGGWAEPSHDGEKVPIVNTIFDRTDLSRARP
jgi:hypothetical protein